MGVKRKALGRMNRTFYSNLDLHSRIGCSFCEFAEDPEYTDFLCREIGEDGDLSALGLKYNTGRSRIVAAMRG